MDNQETGSNQPAAPAASTEKDRLASILKSQYGSDFTYEPPESPEPEGQPADEVSRHVAETTAQAEHEASPVETPETPKEPEGQTEDDFETVEVDGAEYRVPKELKDHLLRDRDYRHKTMELAEVKKSVEVEQKFVAHAKQAALQLAPLIAQMGIVDSQLAQLDATNWQELFHADPTQFNSLQHLRRNLLDQKNALAGNFTQAAGAIEQAETAALVAATQRNEPIVRKAIKDWGPEKQQELGQGAQTYYGYKPEELRRLVDARDVMVLNDAIAYRKLMANKPKAITAVKQAPPVSRQDQSRASDAPNVELKKAEARFNKTGEQEDLYRVLRLRRKQ